MFYDELYALSKQKAVHSLWVFSDLQQSKYKEAARCLNIALRDYATLEHPAEMMLYLGDSTEGADYNELLRMTELQKNAFESLGIPLIYVTGNHDYDYSAQLHLQGETKPVMPFYEMVKAHPDWYCAKQIDDTYFKVEIDSDYILYCFCDHIDTQNRWCSTHNNIRWGHEFYPYTDEHFANIRKEMAADPHKYILTASHCAFPGGNRESYLLSKLQPLPLNVKMHLYGHAHIGEYLCPRERVFSCINWVDWQDIPQIDNASLEDVRGSYVRSTILHLYADGSAGLFFRNHNEGKFVQAFFTKRESSEKPGLYAKVLEKWGHK